MYNKSLILIVLSIFLLSSLAIPFSHGVQTGGSIIIHEVGLPSGTTWKVLFDNQVTYQSSTSWLNISNIQNGTYPVQILSVYYYNPNPSSAVATINGNNYWINTTYIYSSTIQFNETGYSGSWIVNFNGNNYATSGPYLNLGFWPNGTYSYYVYPVSGYTILNQKGTITHQAPYPNYVGITFEKNYSFNVYYTGITQSWTLNLNGVNYTISQSPTSINVVNGTYHARVYAPPGYSVSPSNVTFTINGNNENLQFVFSNYVYAVVFYENGLKSLTRWGIVLDSTDYYSTGSYIALNLANGTYQGQVIVPYLYESNISTFSFTVNGKGINIHIGFTELYVISFKESGLISGTKWYVVLNGNNMSSTNQFINFTEPNGTYPYVIGNVSGYTLNLYKGTVQVSNYNITINVVYNVLSYSVVFIESGLPTNAFWTVVFDSYAYSSTTNTIKISNIPKSTYQYQVQSISGYEITKNQTGVVSISSYVTYVNVTFSKLYSVEFQEKGLLNNINWTLNIGSSQYKVTNYYIYVNLINGSYHYNVSPISNYTIVNQSGNFTVPNTLVIYIQFIYKGSAESIISISGLPVGKNIPIMIDSKTYTYLNQFSYITPLILFLNAGNNPYYIPPVPGYSLNQNLYGNLYVYGGKINYFNFSFSQLPSYEISVNENGLLPGTQWYLNYSFNLAYKITLWNNNTVSNTYDYIYNLSYIPHYNSILNSNCSNIVIMSTNGSIIPYFYIYSYLIIMQLYIPALNHISLIIEIYPKSYHLAVFNNFFNIYVMNYSGGYNFIPNVEGQQTSLTTTYANNYVYFNASEANPSQSGLTALWNLTQFKSYKYFYIKGIMGYSGSVSTSILQFYDNKTYDYSYYQGSNFLYTNYPYTTNSAISGGTQTSLSGNPLSFNWVITPSYMVMDSYRLNVSDIYGPNIYYAMPYGHTGTISIGLSEVIMSKYPLNFINPSGITSPAYISLNSILLTNSSYNLFISSSVIYFTAYAFGYRTAYPYYYINITSNTSLTINFFNVLYTQVTFESYGIPSGNLWGVVIDGVNYSTNTNQLTIQNLVNGIYVYQVWGTIRYQPVNPTGVINLNGNSITVNVYFKAYYQFIVYESGLFSNTSWSFYLNGTLYTTSALYYQIYLPNGSYSFQANPIPSYRIIQNSSVLVKINGQSYMLNVVYKYISGYTVTFRAINLPVGQPFDIEIVNVNTYSSISNWINITLAPGFYTYVSLSDPYFVPLNQSGGFSLESNTTIKIYYEELYPVYVHEQGLIAPFFFYFNISSNGNEYYKVLNSSYSQILLPNGTYSYVVDSPGYKVNVSSGSFTINGNFINLYFKFVLVEYHIYVNESGLTLPQMWEFSLYTMSMQLIQNYYSNISYMFIPIQNGSYRFVVQSYGYSPNISQGTFSIQGKNISIYIGFKPIASLYVNINFIENGLPSGTTWTITVTSEINGSKLTKTYTSTSSEITIAVLYGSWISFSVPYANGYAPSPYEETGIHALNNQNILIQFYPPSSSTGTSFYSSMSLYIIIMVLIAGGVIYLRLKRRG